MRRSVVLLAVTALVLSPAAAEGRSKTRFQTLCRDSRERVYPLVLPVDGEAATGRFSLPSGRPRGLVVFGHGYGHTSFSWDRHMLAAARQGLIAVTMDYRGLTFLPDGNGDGLPDSRGWPAMAGAKDLLFAARAFEAICGPETVTILGVSMGANMTGLAVALAGERGVEKRDGGPLFDYWIDVEGAVNVTETYLEARTLAPVNAFAAQAQSDIEKETGGPIEQQPQAFRDRTVVARIDDIAAAGLDGAVVIHGIDDGLVPHNQGREMSSLLGASRIPTDMITVGLRDEDSERETTISGNVGSQLDPNYTSPLAGHASEKSTTHIVMNVAFDRLWAIVGGETPAGYRECTANGAVPQRFVCAPATP